MPQIFIEPGFGEKPDTVYCSEECISDQSIKLDDPDSNVFPIDQIKFQIQKEVMGWADTCSVCGKTLKE